MDISCRPTSLQSCGYDEMGASLTPQALSVELMLSFLDQVKTHFTSRPQLFNSFMEICTDYCAQRLDTNEVISRIFSLLKDNHSLVSGFNTLLPPWLKMQLTESRETMASSSHSACNLDVVLRKLDGASPVGVGLAAVNGVGIVHDGQGRNIGDAGSTGVPVVTTVKQASGALNRRQLLSRLKRTSLSSSDGVIHTCAKRTTEPISSDEDSVPVPKRARTSEVTDTSRADIAKYGTYTEFKFFDKMQRVLGNEETYLNFLRCVNLYTNDLVSSADLLHTLKVFTVKCPELYRQLQQMMRSDSRVETNNMDTETALSLDIDYASCKKYGVSYRALPDSYPQPKCSGRTPLCQEVLNDRWVSFPCWSEDWSFNNTKRTPYEEFQYRCEDERFELDIVIDNNRSTIAVLDAVQRRMSRMSPEEQARLQLDESLGGTSAVLHCKVLQRVYGDKTSDMLEGLKRKPQVAVPIVLRRLKAKDEEWREAQSCFSKRWREQTEKYYLRSINNQAVASKQTDTRQMRSKTLLNEIEAIFEEQCQWRTSPSPGLQLQYTDKACVVDAGRLLQHYVMYQAAVQDIDRPHIQRLLHLLPTLLYQLDATRNDVVGDEQISRRVRDKRANLRSHSAQNAFTQSILFTNDSWYLYVRLHHTLCERLNTIRTCARAARAELVRLRHIKSSSSYEMRPTGVVNGADVGDYYQYTLQLAQRLIEGTIDTSTYEENLRKVYGIQAHVAFTLDRLLQHCIRQVQRIVTDEVGLQLLQLFEQESPRSGLQTDLHRSMAENSYRRHAQQLLPDENCFRVVILNGRVSMEIVSDDAEMTDDMLDVKQWSDFIERYVNVDCDVSDLTRAQLSLAPVYLNRNLRTRKNAATTHCIWTADQMECRFNVNSYRMMFVKDSSSIVYRAGALTSARQHHRSLTVAKFKRMTRWMHTWHSANISAEDDKCCHDWLTGSHTGKGGSRSRGREQRDFDRPPYHSYTKYCIAVKHPFHKYMDLSTDVL